MSKYVVLKGKCNVDVLFHYNITGRDYNGEWDNWFGPDGHEGAYNKDLVLISPAGKAISALKLLPSKDDIDKLR